MARAIAPLLWRVSSLSFILCHFHCSAFSPVSLPLCLPFWPPCFSALWPLLLFSSLSTLSLSCCLSPVTYEDQTAEGVWIFLALLTGLCQGSSYLIITSVRAMLKFVFRWALSRTVASDSPEENFIFRWKWRDSFAVAIIDAVYSSSVVNGSDLCCRDAQCLISPSRMWKESLSSDRTSPYSPPIVF